METGQLEYRAAVTEFDRLWETGAAGRQPERMQQLLQVIDAVEAAPAASQAGGRAGKRPFHPRARPGRAQAGAK